MAPTTIAALTRKDAQADGISDQPEGRTGEAERQIQECSVGAHRNTPTLRWRVCDTQVERRLFASRLFVTAKAQARTMSLPQGNRSAEGRKAASGSASPVRGHIAG